MRDFLKLWIGITLALGLSISFVVCAGVGIQWFMQGNWLWGACAVFLGTFLVAAMMYGMARVIE